MDKDEILEKSRNENRNRDIYEQEVLKQANTSAVLVMTGLAMIFCMVQLFVGGGVNYGIWAIVISANTATFWVKYIKLRRRHELLIAIAETVGALAISAIHIHDLIAESANLLGR